MILLGIWRKILLLAVLLASTMAAPAHALVPAAAETETPAAPTEPQIADTAVEGTDERISDRVRDIFDQLPSLSGVSVSVSKGVVSLTGTVPDAAARDRAQAIASRVDGVVTVENSLERDVSVDGSLGVLGDLSDRMSAIARMLPLIGVALGVAFLIGLVGYVIAGLSVIWRRFAPNSFLAELIASAIRFVFVIGGLVVALEMIGAVTLLGALLGGAGVIGIALGFAMRDTVENYVASLMLSLRQPFRANEWVEIDEFEGRVIRLTSRATILMTLDGNHLRIPNSTVFKAVILNYTRNPQRRFEFDLGIDAEDDPTAARHIGVEAMRTMPFILEDPEPQGRVVEVGDSNIVLKFLGWINQNETDWYKAKSRTIPAVKDALEAAGFLLPEPIYRLRFDPGTQLPLGEAASAETPAKPRIPATSEVPEGAVSDIAPENEVKRMVEAERAADPESGKDLLDSGKPVE